MAAEKIKALAFSFLCCAFLSASEPQKKSTDLELGVAAGTPALVSAQFGFWRNEGFPLVIRAAGMFWGLVAGGEVEFGWYFDREGDYRQYLALGGEAGAFGVIATPITDGSWIGGSLRYGFRYKGLTAMVGVTIGRGEGNWLFVFPGSYTGPMPLLKIGYSWYF